MPKSSNSGLKLVAEHAGVSMMTVSRVFRKSPNVSPETRQRVLATAKELDYHPDPLVSQLMARVRQQRHTGERATLALVYDHAAPADSHQYVSLKQIRSRAHGHGYRVEPFRIGQGGVSAKRLQGILRTRDIRGVLLSVSSRTSPAANMDFSQLAAVTFGFGLDGLSLHRASTNITEGMLSIFERLKQRGYQRIGVAITPWVDFRAGHTYSGALLHYQQSLTKTRRVPMFLLAGQHEKKHRQSFEAWLRKHSPDVLISVHEPVVDWLTQLGIQVPEDMGLVIHDWVPTPEMNRFAGMNHRRDEVAAAAVDLLAAHLQHHEYGLPEAPRQILTPPTFVDGSSLRK